MRFKKKKTIKNPYFSKKRKLFEPDPKRSIDKILDEMSLTAFQGRSLGEAFHVWEKMLEDRNATIFLGYSGSLSTAGMWKIIYWLIEKRFIDVLVSTGANVSEDIIEAMGFNYWLGSWRVDDADLLKYRINRFYDHYVSDWNYIEMEEMIGEFICGLDPKKIYSSRSFLYELGLFLRKKNIWSLVTIAAERQVPIFSPALIDSGFGEGVIAAKQKGKSVIIDQARDMHELTEIGEKTMIKKRGRTGVIYIGGGVPKDMTQLVAESLTLLDPKGRAFPHYYAVQLTTDSPQWGGLSGCTIGEEAISWGKEAPEGENATVYCDATIALPILTTAITKRVKKRFNPPDLSWLFSQDK